MFSLQKELLSLTKKIFSLTKEIYSLSDANSGRMRGCNYDKGNILFHKGNILSDKEKIFSLMLIPPVCAAATASHQPNIRAAPHAAHNIQINIWKKYSWKSISEQIFLKKYFCKHISVKVLQLLPTLTTIFKSTSRKSIWKLFWNERLRTISAENTWIRI